MMLDLPVIIGHRGAARSAPENTLAGFRRAAQEGARWVEFDVKLARDGEPVVIHDDTLDRTTTGHGKVARTSLAEIRTADAGVRFGPEFAGERVPLLTETLELLAALGMGFNLEVKPCPGREAETAEIAARTVREVWGERRPVPIISSFARESLVAAARAAPELPRGLLSRNLPRDWQAAVRACDCRAVHLGYYRVDEGIVRAVRSAGCAMVVWTVNEPARARRLRDWGADSIITDAPAAIAAAL